MGRGLDFTKTGFLNYILTITGMGKVTRLKGTQIEVFAKEVELFRMPKHCIFLIYS